MKDINYYMKLDYRIEIIPDKNEGGYAFSYPELPGCITCSDNLSDGIKMLKDAKRNWLEACIEDGIEIPEPMSLDDYSGQFKIRMPKSLHKKLALRSKQEGISMNQYCIYLLSQNT